MDKLLTLIGAVIGIVGVAMCVAAVVVRLAGSFHLAGMQVGTFLTAGIAGVVIGCLGLLAVLVLRTTPRS